MKATGQPRRPSVDPYIPGHGSPDYRVSHYDLDLDYRVATNRLSGIARLTLTTVRPLAQVSLDLAGLRVSRVMVGGARVPGFVHRNGKLAIRLSGNGVPTGRALEVEVHYGGRPVPLPTPWGEVGWEELTDGVIVAGQPNGAPSWFPCNDHPSDKATFRVSITAESPYVVVSNGHLVEHRVRSSRTRWVFEQPEPMATYLATVHIGRYELRQLAEGPVPQSAAVPRRLLGRFTEDFARQPEMMKVFEDLFGPYPFGEYRVVVTDDELEIPLEAQGLAAFGANHVTGRGAWERLIAHELAHQWFGNSLTAATWRHVWLHEGFACYAEWLWSERSGGPAADSLARLAWQTLRRLPEDLVLADPGPAHMFDDRVYKRGALTVHALRLAAGDAWFFPALRAWSMSNRHGLVTTESFVDFFSNDNPPLRTLLHAWLREPALPALPVGR